MREDTRGRVGGWTTGNGALEVLKTWCEVRTWRTTGPSDVALKSGCVCVCAQWGHDLSVGRTLEKPGPALYSPECVEVEFSEGHPQTMPIGRSTVSSVAPRIMDPS
jgi:hypothetical protein